MAQTAMAYTGVLATVLAPFYYHGIYVPDGSSTDPTVLSDTTIMFALAHSLGCPPSPFPRSSPAYTEDVAKLPWKASLFISLDAYETNSLLPPIRHSLDMEREGGYQESLQKGMASGNVKKIWWVHEVAPDSQYTGVLFGRDPFALYRTDHIIVRVGVGRLGIIRLEPVAVPEVVRLNAATARLFDQELEEDYRVLDTIRVSEPISIEVAAGVVSGWSVRD
ncbi:hypothetical protein [Kyrpidia sp.]|uniref:hypothetical protein n=1 Tax=Kyrpidia sp. TaxID=2073077 RepID=UPI00258D8EF0|nr:hypothetical protein [Kyrpidia sp.]MCL6576734.1 hypothetical protein [Kyrpidia sp.]